MIGGIYVKMRYNQLFKKSQKMHQCPIYFMRAYYAVYAVYTLDGASGENANQISVTIKIEIMGQAVMLKFFQALCLLDKVQF